MCCVVVLCFNLFLSISFFAGGKGSSVDSIVMKPENIPIQVTTIKLTKDNYLHWAAAIKMTIVGRGCVNGKKKQPGEDESWWNQ